MNDQAREFLKKASEDETLSSKLKAFSGITDRTEAVEKAAEIAQEAGFTVSPEDFEPDEGKMDDAEVANVAGGWRECVCVLLGGGDGDKDGKACVCVVGGGGLRRDNDEARCECVAGGLGDETFSGPPCEAMNGVG